MSRRIALRVGLAIAGALAIGAALIWISGHNPLDAYRAMLLGAFAGSRGTNLVATLNRAVPIIGMGIAAAIAFRGGLLNIGGEGQLVLGGLAAALVGLSLPFSGPPAVVLALGAAAVAGLLWGLLPAALEFRLGLPILITSLLLNYPARYFASYVVGHPLRDVGSGMAQTARLPADTELGRVAATRLHWGLVVVLVLAVLTAWILVRTRFGFHLRLAGLNPTFTRYGGVDMSRLGYRIMATSGGVAGLVGGVLVLAVHHRFIDGSLTSPLYAWVGIMVALLARSRPLAVLAAGLFFAALQSGGFAMERATEVPRELSQVLQALIILFVAAGSRIHVLSAAPTRSAE